MIKLAENINDDEYKDHELAIDLAAATRDFFVPDSPLKDAVKYGGRPYEYRPQQSEMASGIAHALSNCENLCVEAPTGIGKSFAYLVPAALFAVNQPKPVVISTETINLQEQLIEKDIPIIAEILKLDFKAVLAKGRSNYLCLRRLKLATGDRKDEFLPLASLMSDVERVRTWSEITEDGSRSSIDFKFDQQIWNSICCEGGNCAGPKCEHFRHCFYWRARREWERADIIVANHALFFSDLNLKQGEDLEKNLLPLYSAVIIDESHTLEDNAAEYMGLRISKSGMMHFLNRLFNSSNGKGVLGKPGEECLEMRKLVAKIQEYAGSFYKMTEEILNSKNDSVLRLKNPNFVQDLLSEQLSLLGKQLRKYAEGQDDNDIKTEISSYSERAESFSKGIHDFLNMVFEKHVYWVEEKEKYNGGNIEMFAAPLNINEILRERLFSKPFPVILTSATLAVKKSLDYYCGRTGYTGGEKMVLDSPFDFKNQVKIYIPKNMPEPDHPSYLDSASNEIQKFLEMTHGKAFVLFTSHQMLRKCAEKLSGFFTSMNINLLVQNENSNRSQMIKEFKRDINSVIFGAASFWTGVDVPGEALSNIIITKLPFAVPSHPLIQARSENIEEAGLNSFFNYSLPEAALKFRQGIGRLIRSKTDKGIIVILDRRIISKKYGQFFLDSIPESPIQVC